MRSRIVWPEPDFPRTATGKPRLSVIAARAARILNAPQADNSSHAAWSPLRELLAQIAPSAPAADHLESELNLSSLERVELMSALEAKFHVELNETAFSNAKTVADVERLLEHPAAGHTHYFYPRWAQREPVRWLRLLVYYGLVWPATELLGHPKIIGREHLHRLRSPVLVISNHITRRADIGLILRSLPLRCRHRLAIAMGGETVQEMREPPQDWFILRRWAYRLGYWLITALFNVFPLPQFAGFRESFRFAGEAVDRGYSVLVFPEGQVNNTATGEMAPFQSGVGLLAENLRIPVVPMRLEGVWQMKREHRRLARLGELTVRIGAPVTFPPGTPPGEIARRLEALVRSL
jgi:long-chain acyl-CoA synthetase